MYVYSDGQHSAGETQIVNIEDNSAHALTHTYSHTYSHADTHTGTHTGTHTDSAAAKIQFVLVNRFCE